MGAECTHVPSDLAPPDPTTPPGCTTCIAAGRRDWIHLRICQSCGHVGCCDDSPGRHATAHAGESEHPLVRSMEPGENWWFCYPDNLLFMVADAPPSPTRTA